MIRLRRSLPILFLPAVLLQTAPGYQVDQIPRHRLVTTKEFFSSLDTSHPALAEIQMALSQKDTFQATESLLRYFRTRTSPRYFFDPAAVPQRAREFAMRYPHEAEAIQQGAEGFKSTYGPDVDWIRPGKDRTGREHTPNTIRFLARQWHAENIALSHFFVGGTAKNIDFLITHVRDFVMDYEAGRAESGANDVFERFYAGHRTRNWLFMHHLLLGSPDYRPEDQLFMVKVFLLHGARLVDQSKRFNWGNHQLHGLCALFEMTAMYPEIAVMREWNARALALILDHLEKEVAADGFQFERASHYHKLDIVNYFRVYRLSQLNGIALPEWYENRFKSMFGSIMSLAMPTRELPVLQDAQDSQRRRASDVNAGTAYGLAQPYTDAAEFPEPQEALFMSLGALLFEDPEFKFFGSRTLPAAWYWFFGPEAFRHYASLQTRKPSLGSVALRETGYYVMRTGWDPEDLYMIIDGGLAQHKPDHTHGGILGVILYGHGSVLLPNYHVRYSNPDYKILKNSLAKNVALVDTFLQGRGWRDNKARTGFGVWTELPTPTVLAWETDSSYDYFSATHNGFDSIGVKYSRSILFVKPSYWLLADDFEAKQRHTYQQIWQGEHRTGGRRNTSVQDGDKSRLAIIQTDENPVPTSQQMSAGNRSLWFHKEGAGHVSFLTVLFPGRTSDKQEVSISRGENGLILLRFGDHEDRITWPSGSRSEITIERWKRGRKISAIRTGRAGLMQ